MKFEKLTNNKIRITLTLKDMLINKVSTQSFLGNQTIPQKFLNSLLVEAEKRLGFKTEDSKLLVEAITSNDGGFIFTITKLSFYDNSTSNNSYKLYKFKSFDDFLSFCTYIKNLKLKVLPKDFSLILYNKIYYLKFSNDVTNSFEYILNILAEFSEPVVFSPTTEGLFAEYGKVIFNRNAINKCIKSFQ